MGTFYKGYDITKCDTIPEAMTEERAKCDAAATEYAKQVEAAPGYEPVIETWESWDESKGEPVYYAALYWNDTSGKVIAGDGAKQGPFDESKYQTIKKEYEKHAGNLPENVYGENIGTSYPQHCDAKCKAQRDANADEAAKLKQEAADDTKAHQQRTAKATADSQAAKEAKDKAAEEQKKKEEEAAKELGETRIAYREQCLLMSQIATLTKFKKDNETSKQMPYPGGSGVNASLQVEGAPYAFINKLTQYPNFKYFFDMTNAETSNLMPMIRLFKISQDDDGSEAEVEFNFDSHASSNEVQNFIGDKNKRGFGVGIKDFTFSYVGSNPFSAKKSIEAKLTIFANSFDELLSCRGKGKCGEGDASFADRASSYRYADLALKTGGKNLSSRQLQIEDVENNLSKLQFILKAVIGWAIPKNIPSANEAELLDALYNSYVTLFLTPTIHEFKIDEMGRVTFTLNYLAYIEDFFDQPNFDIFSDPVIAAKQKIRKIIFKNLTTQCKASEINELKETQADSINKEKKDNLKSLCTRLLANDKIKYFALSQEDMKQYQGKGVFFTPTSLNIITPAGTSEEEMKEAVNETVDDAKTDPNEKAKKDPADKNEFSKAMMDPKNTVLPFFYVSDLIDIILPGIDVRMTDVKGQLVQQQIHFKTNFPELSAKIDINSTDIRAEGMMLNKFDKQYKKFRVVLGPLEIVDPKSGTSSYISFGDLPISYKYFIEWLTDKMLKKDEEVYHLGKFLNDFFNNLVRNFLNDDTCFKIKSKQRVRLQQVVLTSYPIADTDEISEEIDMQTGSRLNIDSFPESSQPLLNISGPEGLPLSTAAGGKEINYLIFFAGRVMPLELMKGDREQDEDRGIFHYMLGKNRGIVKNISLSRTDAKYLKEVRFEQEGYDGLEQLREVYDATVDCYPLVNAFPGTYIYIEPRGFAPNSADFGSDIAFDLTKYGIGGYHMIWKSEHSFGIGRAESKIYAKWVAEKFYDSETSDQKSTDGLSTTSPSKCDALKADDPASSESEAPPTTFGATAQSDTVSSAPDAQTAQAQIRGGFR